MEPESSLPHSQASATCPYPELDALISQIYFWNTLHLFRTVPLSIISSFSLYTQQWYMSYMFADSLLGSSQRNLCLLLCLQ